MKGQKSRQYSLPKWPARKNVDSLHQTLRKWQQVRTWARLILEAESLWHVDVKEVRRLAALELSQLLDEVPSSDRERVDRWLEVYSASTRFSNQNLKKRVGNQVFKKAK